MSLFAISDLHLSFDTDKPMDVFGKGWDNYVQRLQTSWNSIVSNNDTVIIPGDISWATYIDDAVKDFEYINSLNGKKLILKGNHDYWWTTMNKMEIFLKEHDFSTIQILHNNAYLYDGIAICGTRGWVIPSPESTGEDKKMFEREKQRLILSLESAKTYRTDEIIVAMHYPPVDKDGLNEDFLNIMREYGVTQCVFGHLHSTAHTLAPTGYWGNIKLRLVSSDYLKFIPALIR